MLLFVILLWTVGEIRYLGENDNLLLITKDNVSQILYLVVTVMLGLYDSEKAANY